MSDLQPLPPAKASQARSTLRQLQTGHPEIDSCALMTSDGRVGAAVLGAGVDADRFGAMCAALLVLAARAAEEAERGDLRQVILDGRAGPMLLTRAGEHGVLAVAAQPGSQLGKLIIDSKRTAQTLGQLLEA